MLAKGCLALLPPVLISLLCGCATVRVESMGQDVRVERQWGVLAVTVGESNASHVAEMTSLGFARGPFGWSAGYTHQSWAALGPECRLVIWVSAAEHLAAARQLANGERGVCVANLGNESHMEVGRHESKN